MNTVEGTIDIPVRLPWMVVKDIAVEAYCRGWTWNDVAVKRLKDYTIEELNKGRSS